MLWEFTKRNKQTKHTHTKTNGTSAKLISNRYAWKLSELKASLRVSGKKH